MSVIENPFAFPSPDDGRPSDGYGMDLRDYFAGQALTGLLQVRSELVDGESAFAGHEQLAADDAYRFADAMLLARKSRD